VKRWFRHFRGSLEDEVQRLQRLVTQGKTVQIADVGPEDTVFVAALGYGDEFWSVAPDFDIDLEVGELRGGRLIMDGGIPLRDRQRLSFLRKTINRLSYRV
jgi:hypothetical protein